MQYYRAGQNKQTLPRIPTLEQSPTEIKNRALQWQDHMEGKSVDLQGKKKQKKIQEAPWQGKGLKATAPVSGCKLSPTS